MKQGIRSIIVYSEFFRGVDETGEPCLSHYRSRDVHLGIVKGSL